MSAIAIQRWVDNWSYCDTAESMFQSRLQNIPGVREEMEHFIHFCGRTDELEPQFRCPDGLNLYAFPKHSEKPIRIGRTIFVIEEDKVGESATSITKNALKVMPWHGVVKYTLDSGDDSLMTALQFLERCGNAPSYDNRFEWAAKITMDRHGIYGGVADGVALVKTRLVPEESLRYTEEYGQECDRPLVLPSLGKQS